MCVVYMEMQSAKTNQRKHQHIVTLPVSLSLSLCVTIFATDDHVQSSTPQRKSRTNHEEGSGSGGEGVQSSRATFRQ